MCGILSIFSRNSQPVNISALEAGLKTLFHRGPDCQKTWVSPQKNVGLGHTRLSIIDLVTGTQPLANETNQLHLVANGEFYGYETQRAQLEKKGHPFRTLSDSEIVLHLYEELGPDCLEQLRGEFAFVLWDEDQQLIFAARDRFGIKPLFYSIYNNQLYLASEVKALFAAGVPANWDEESMAIFASTTLLLPDRTHFKNVFQIPPGHFLIATKNSLKIYPYWDINYPQANSFPERSKKEYVEELRAKFEEAVRLRLRADVPVGCYLSGGLDSSAVLGMAAKFSSTPTSAFTLSFDKVEYDEEKIAKEMAIISGAKYHPIPIRQDDLAQHFSDAIWHGETFFYNGHGIAKYLLSKAVRDAGYKVVMTGEGADELFAGYPHFRIDKLLHGPNKLNPQERQAFFTHLKETNAVSIGMLLPSDETNMIESVQKILGFTPAWILAGSQDGARLSKLLSPAFLKATQAKDGFDLLLNSMDIDTQLKQRDPINQSLYLWSKFRLPSYLLTILGDRMEMAHSIEGRLPFLDHHVAEYMRHVPVEFKIHEMTEKYLLREAAQPVLTETVYKRQKHPFLAPPATLDAEKPFNQLMQDTLRSNTMDSIPFFDRKKVVDLLDRLPTMSARECVVWDPILMVILSTCVMQERFGIGC